jgi:GntR family transcriptional regulator, rspAB operon transcriptional repressor
MRLKERAYLELRELLLSGELPPGALISERQLVARFAFSKTPIRVALERLERDGFVEILPQRGVRVRGLSDKEIADHFDLRLALETWVVRRLAEASEPLDWSEVGAALDGQRAAVEADDRERYALTDADFHDRLAVLAGNDEIVRVIRVQRERLFRIIVRIHDNDPARPAVSLAEHVGIVEAVRRRDADEAEARMRDHLGWGRRFLLSLDGR